MKGHPMILYGNTTKISPSMLNVASLPLQAQAPFSHHTSTGEDAPHSMSEHWAITSEPVSTIRQAVEAIIAANPDICLTTKGHLSQYQAVRAQYLMALDQVKIDTANKAAKADAKRNRQLKARRARAAFKLA
jgi:hypothetical protein